MPRGTLAAAPLQLNTSAPPPPASSDHWQLGPHAEPDWWNWIRQLLMFLLGIAVICYAITTDGHDVALLVTGLILLGIIPIEHALTSLSLRNDKPRTPPTGDPPP